MRYLVAGVAFGFVLTKAEAVSWFRIQEMFRLESVHMYGLLVSAIAVALVTTRVLRATGARAATGEPIALAPKPFERGTRYWAGGSMFGVGWAITGACPGPLFALVGAGITTYLVVIAGALTGTWTYGRLRSQLPH